MTGRKYTKMYRTTWQDAAFQKLTPGAQRLYWLLLAQSNRSSAGVLPLQVTKWAKFSIHTTPVDIREHLDELEAHSVVLVDADTEEVLIRGHIRDDIADVENPPSWKVQKGAVNSCSAVESVNLRVALADELENVLPLLRPEAVEAAQNMVRTLRDNTSRNPTDSLSKPNRTTATATATATATPECCVGEGVQGEGEVFEQTVSVPDDSLLDAPDGAGLE